MDNLPFGGGQLKGKLQLIPHNTIASAGALVKGFGHQRMSSASISLLVG